MEEININENNKNNNLNIETLISLYNNKLLLKNKEVESLKNKIKINKEKLNNIRKENEIIKEQNYNYKINNQKNINLEENKIKSNNKYKYKKKDKYLSSIEEDNQNYIKNELIFKISSFYNKIFKLVGQTNDNIINEYIDLDNIDDLIELEKNLKFIEENINKKLIK